MASMVNLPTHQGSSWPSGIQKPILPESASGRDNIAEPAQNYFGLEGVVETDPVEMDKFYRILKDFKTGLPPEEDQRLAHLIYEVSYEYQYDPELILALIVTESSFYNWSRSRVGAVGLMQIMPTTGLSLAESTKINWTGIATLFDPSLNIRLGIKYLAMMHDQFGNLEIALTAYNYGPTRVREMLRRGEKLPKTYSEKVLSAYKRFLELEPQDMVES